MRVCSIDLELNMPGQLDRIIQIGYVIGNVLTGEIFVSRRIYVELPPDEMLQPFIEQLTGIKAEQLTFAGGALSFIQAYAQILADVTEWTETKTGKAWMPLIQWGGGDDRLIKKNVEDDLHWRKSPVDWPFGRSSWDVKKHVQSYLIAHGLRMQGGLKKSCNKLGVRFNGPAHDALNDAKATFDIYVQVLKIFKGGPDVLSRKNEKS